MARSPFDKLKDATTGAIGIGRTVAGQLVKTAGPRISRTAGVVISHLPRHKPAPTPVREESTPAAKVPPAKAPAMKAPAAEPAKHVSAPDAAPTPAAVAKNIPKHPPTPKKASPGAKLPPKRARTAPAKKVTPGAKLPPKKAVSKAE